MPIVAALLLLSGVALAAMGALALRRSRARIGMARRLAGAHEVRISELLNPSGGSEPPRRPIRLAGRVRATDPIVNERDERLVALHRDVEVRLPDGSWRPIERVRETRGMELYDHAGSLTLDPADAAEPLVAIPHVWMGSPDELGPAYAPAVARLKAEHGILGGARSVSRSISVVDRLLVLGQVRRDGDNQLRLLPPPGGFVISNLELDAAMRLLGGGRHWLLLGAAGVSLGTILAVTGILLAMVLLPGS